MTPTPLMVYQTYKHECGYDDATKRGALRRTGERYDRSDQWAANMLKRYEAEQDTSDDLAYVPPPGGYPEPVPPIIEPVATTEGQLASDLLPSMEVEQPTDSQQSPTVEPVIMSPIRSVGTIHQLPTMPIAKRQYRQEQGTATMLAYPDFIAGGIHIALWLIENIHPLYIVTVVMLLLLWQIFP